MQVAYMKYILTPQSLALSIPSLMLMIAPLCAHADSYPGRLISVDLQDTDMDNFLRIVAEVSNMNIIQIEPIRDKVTFRGIDRPWGVILDTVLSDHGGYKVIEGNVIKTYPLKPGELQPPKAEEKVYSGKLISLDLQDTNLDNALRILEEASNRKFLGRDSLNLEATVTLRLIDVPWDQALSIVLEQVGAAAESNSESTRIVAANRAD